MTGSKADARSTARARAVRFSPDELTVEISDGRTISVPLSWYPRLAHGSAVEREKWELIADGHGIHWPDLDEDLSVEGLLDGHSSPESPKSIERWLASRAAQA